jgi:hypothetical protein
MIYKNYIENKRLSNTLILIHNIDSMSIDYRSCETRRSSKWSIDYRSSKWSIDYRSSKWSIDYRSSKCPYFYFYFLRTIVEHKITVKRKLCHTMPHNARIV